MKAANDAKNMRLRRDLFRIFTDIDNKYWTEEAEAEEDEAEEDEEDIDE